MKLDIISITLSNERRAITYTNAKDILQDFQEFGWTVEGFIITLTLQYEISVNINPDQLIALANNWSE